jgi:hypothetical protein
MKRQYLVVCSALLAFAANAVAQRAEIFGDYTFMQYNPTITGVQSRALHGGGGGGQLNFAKIFGIKAEFQGYMSTQVTVDVKSPISTPKGILPIGTYKSNATMFTYFIGPVVRIPAKHIRPFGELLFGGTNTNLYAQLNNSLIAGGGKIDATGETQHPFAMAFGGGLDIAVNKSVALRVAEMDWVLTRFTNVFTNTNNQHSFRYLAGVVFTFGAH